MADAAADDGTTTGANAPPAGEEEARASLEGLTPVLVLTPTDASASDGGLMSDADPYCIGTAGQPLSSSPRADQPSKLRYSEP